MPLKLLIKKIDDDGRLSLVPQFLDTAWEIEVVNTDDLDAFDRALSHADAMVSMSWKWDLPSACTPQTAAAARCRHRRDRFLPRTTRAPRYAIATSTRSASPNTCSAPCWSGPSGCVTWIRASGKGTGPGPTCADRCTASCSARPLGIVGYGRIGHEVARRAKSFGMKIIACTRTPRQEDEFADRVDGMERFDNLLSEADFVVVTSPLNEQTRDLFDQRAFAAMRPAAVIINVARGAIINEAALYDALKRTTHRRRCSRRLVSVSRSKDRARGAPAASYPFHELDNVLMTPHASAWTDGLLPRRNRAIAMNLNRLARGEPLLNVVRAPEPDRRSRHELNARPNSNASCVGYAVGLLAAGPAACPRFPRQSARPRAQKAMPSKRCSSGAPRPRCSAGRSRPPARPASRTSGWTGRWPAGCCAERVRDSGAQLPLGGNHMRVAEPEFAFRMARDLPPRAQAYTAAGSARRSATRCTRRSKCPTRATTTSPGSARRN